MPGAHRRRLSVLSGHCCCNAPAASSAAASLAKGGPELQFYIFGQPVSMSPSPVIHTAGFRANGFAHTYTTCDTDSVAAVVTQIRDPGCGGGSVTIPHKETLIPLLDTLSDAARKIGAVNTVTKKASGELHGDNTDWLGIKRGLEGKRGGVSGAEASVGLVVGAGGTARAACHALQQMGVERVLILNPRTPSRAVAMAAGFAEPAGRVNGVAEGQLAAAVEAAGRLDFVVNTLPGPAGYILPESVVPFVKRWRPATLVRTQPISRIC